MNYHGQQWKKIELQGTGSTPRKICRDSHSIRKSSTAGPMLQARKPVIMHVRPPKVIHADPQDFMALVQRLTGSSPCAESAVEREPTAQILHPSTPTPSQSTTSPAFDENVSSISPSVPDDDQRDMGRVTVDVPAKLEEELAWDNPPNMTSLYAEDHRISSPFYAALHSVHPTDNMLQ